MASPLELLGLPAYTGALDRTLGAIETGAKRAVIEAGVQMQRLTQINLTGPPRWKDGKHYPREWGGPGVLTGNLRRSVIINGPFQEGLTTFSILVGPTATYAAAQEFGHPRWHRGKGYPYVQPAYNAMVRHALRPIFYGAARAAILHR